MSQMKRDELKELSADELLEMDTDDIAEVGIVLPPAAVYQATLASSLEDVETPEGTKKLIRITCNLDALVEFIEGPDKETAEQMADSEGNIDIPPTLVKTYFVQGGINQFKTDWGKVGKEANGGGKQSVIELIESLNGLSVEFTHKFYRKTDNDGNKKIYSNIVNAALLTV